MPQITKYSGEALIVTGAVHTLAGFWNFRHELKAIRQAGIVDSLQTDKERQLSFLVCKQWNYGHFAWGLHPLGAAPHRPAACFSWVEPSRYLVGRCGGDAPFRLLDGVASGASVTGV